MPNPYGPKAPPILRLPGGGYFAYSTTRCASSRVLIIGTTTPHVPASRAHLNHSTLLAGMRTKGGQGPAPAPGGNQSGTRKGILALCSPVPTSPTKPNPAQDFF